MRRALITGAASGIGRAALDRLRNTGWAVTGLDRATAPPGLAAERWLRCDLADPAALDDALAQLATPQLDALVLSAGVAGVGDVRRILQINFLAARRMVAALVPHLRDGAAITLVSSGAGWRWMDSRAELVAVLEEADEARALERAVALCRTPAEAYNRSKELLCALAAHACLDHRSRGIRINSVSPGSVATPLIADFVASMGDEAMAFSRATVGRDGRPEEVAEVIAFLSDRRASWINGADIKVDGGLTGALASGAARFAGWEDEPA